MLVNMYPHVACIAVLGKSGFFQGMHILHIKNREGLCCGEMRLVWHDQLNSVFYYFHTVQVFHNQHSTSIVLLGGFEQVLTLYCKPDKNHKEKLIGHVQLNLHPTLFTHGVFTEQIDQASNTSIYVYCFMQSHNRTNLSRFVHMASAYKYIKREIPVNISKKSNNPAEKDYHHNHFSVRPMLHSCGI